MAAAGGPPAAGGTAAAGGLDRLYEVIAQLQGVPIAASVLERDIFPCRVHGYTPRLFDELLATGEVLWVGAGSLGRDDGRVVLALRDQAGLVLPRFGFGPESPADGRPTEAIHSHVRDVLGDRGACFFRELGGPGLADGDVLKRCGTWCGRARSPTTPSPRSRATVASAGRPGPDPTGPAETPSARLARRPGPPRGQGRWSLVARGAGPLRDVTAATLARPWPWPGCSSSVTAS